MTVEGLLLVVWNGICRVTAPAGRLLDPLVAPFDRRYALRRARLCRETAASLAAAGTVEQPSRFLALAASWEER